MSFQKNLDRWSHYAPKEAVLLPYVDETELRIVKNLLIGPKGAYEPFKKIEAPKGDVLVIYGVGLGESLPLVKKWLEKEPKRRLVYFEEDPRVIKHLLQSKAGEALIHHPQVELHYIESFEDPGPFEPLYWASIGKKIEILASPSYLKWYPSRFEAFQNKIIHESSIKNSLVSEYLELSIPFFRNFYANIKELPKAHLGTKLFNKFKNVPAIITGAGPSLEKQIPNLKKVKDKVLIFSGGSSLNALLHHGLKPHFGAGIDPNSLQIKRLEATAHAKIPFFYRNRLHFEALKKVQGLRLYIPGAGGYDLPNFYEEKFKIPSDFIDEGFNVVNFLIQIATLLGCNPIILVGLDLAFTDKKTYAKGIVTDKEKIEHVQEEEHILREDYQGKPIYTQWKWLAEAEWIHNFQKGHPNVKILNATEGGLKIEGIEHTSFNSIPLKKKAIGLDKALEATKSAITEKQINALTKKMRDSLERSEKLLIKLKEDADARAKKFKEPSAQIALLEEELLDEPAYTYILDMYNTVYAHKQGKDLSDLKLKELSKIAHEKEKLKLQVKRIEFLLNVVRVNLKLIDWAEEPMAKISA